MDRLTAETFNRANFPNRISIDELKTLTAAELENVKPSKLNFLSQEQFQLLDASGFTLEQIRAFTFDTIRMFSVEQLGNLARGITAELPNTFIISLDIDQAKALYRSALDVQKAAARRLLPEEQATLTGHAIHEMDSTVRAELKGSQFTKGQVEFLITLAKKDLENTILDEYEQSPRTAAAHKAHIEKLYSTPLNIKITDQQWRNLAPEVAKSLTPETLGQIPPEKLNLFIHRLSHKQTFRLTGRIAYRFGQAGFAIPRSNSPFKTMPARACAWIGRNLFPTPRNERR